MNANYFLKRLDRGWSLEEALEIPVDKNNCGGKPLSYEYYDKEMTIEQISKITGIEAKVIQKRLNRGWSIYEAAEIPKRKY